MSKAKIRQRAAKKEGKKASPERVEGAPAELEELFKEPEPEKENGKPPEPTQEELKAEFEARYKRCVAGLTALLDKEGFHIVSELTPMVEVGGKHTAQISCQWGLKPNEMG